MRVIVRHREFETSRNIEARIPFAPIRSPIHTRKCDFGHADSDHPDDAGMSTIRNDRMRATTHGMDWPNATSSGAMSAENPSSHMSRDSETTP